MRGERDDFVLFWGFGKKNGDEAPSGERREGLKTKKLTFYGLISKDDYYGIYFFILLYTDQTILQRNTTRC